MDKNLLNEKLPLIPQNLLKRMLSVIFSCDTTEPSSGN